MLKPAPPPSKWLYVLAAVGGVTTGVVAIVAVTIVRPNSDNTQLIATIVSLIAPTVAAILALIKGSENANAVQELRLDVDGRLTQLLQRTAEAEHATGLLRGREEGEAKTVAQVVAMTEAADKTTQAAAQVTEIAAKVAEVAATSPSIDIAKPEAEE